MEGTGFSMFQGPSIHINNSAEDRLEEQEELEDQKRRKEELSKKLDVAFDDLQDDEDSVNNSANFTADQSQFPSKEDLTHKLPQYRDHINNKAHVMCETPKNTPMYQTHNYYTPTGAGDGQIYCQELKGQMNGLNMQLFDNRQEQQNIVNFEKLKVMYEMRIKECSTMAADNANLRSEYDKEIHMLQSQLSAAVIDKEKTELSLQQAQYLLSSSKIKINDLEQQVNSLNNKIVLCNEEREQMKLELQSCTMTLQETQHRLHSTQVDHTHKTDSLFREQQIRHREEIDRLQEDLIKVKNRLEEKDREMKSLEMRYKERDSEHEKLIVEKSATINKLARELESAQNQMTNNESGKMKEKIAQKQIRELGSKLETTAHELTQTRSRYSNLDKEYKDWHMRLQQIIQECSKPERYIGEPNSPGKLSTLKDILTGYEQEVQKLKTLQDEISKRDKKLEMCRKQESELRATLDEQKTIEMQLKTKMTLLQDKLDLLGLNNDSELLESYKKQNTQLQQKIEQLRDEHKTLDLKYTELEMENEKLKAERESRTNKAQEINSDLLKEFTQQNGQLKRALEDNNKLKNLYFNISVDCKNINEKLKAAEKEKESLISKEAEFQVLLEKERQQVTKLTTDLTVEREESERANMRISELQKEFSEKQKEFNDKLNKYIEEERTAVRKELDICTQCEKYIKSNKSLKDQLNSCQLELAKQESNEELIDELKKKAEYFQKYVTEKIKKFAQWRSIGTNTEPVDEEAKLDVKVNGYHDHDEDDLTAKTRLMLKEKEIRDQIAEKYTIEIKTIEMKCSKKIKEMQNEHLCNVNKLKQLLERKVDEVETLKQFILSERTKITEILEAKESEISILIKENNSLQSEFQEFRDKATDLKNALEKANTKMSKLKIDLEKKCTELTNEREKFLRIQSDLTQKLHVCEAKLAQLEAQHTLLKEKYKKVKKTAFTYKEYAAKKDVHVENELDRIKNHYKDIITELETRIQQFQLNKRQHAEVTERINKIQSNFNAMMTDQNRQL